tara:strand:- start:979 stop:1425 length:447 start_codon:yes stop_codon:yes gene_type:complete
MIVTNKQGGPQASGVTLKGDFNALSASEMLDFSTWYKQNLGTIAYEYDQSDNERSETLNEYALWLFQEYPQRVAFLKRQARAEQLFESVVACELEDAECDPQAGSAPYMESATVCENGLERTLDRGELDLINEFCAEGVQEWFVERYA